MDTFDREIEKFALPIGEQMLGELKEAEDGLSEFSTHACPKAVSHFRSIMTESGPDFVVELAETILAKPFSGLTRWDCYGDRHYWFSFGEAPLAAHVASPGSSLGLLSSKFPIASVMGLAEFLSKFGGMALGFLPPGGWFCRPQEPEFVAKGEHGYLWCGQRDEWDKALVLFQGDCGNRILVRTDGVIGQWNLTSGCGWDEEDSTAPDPYTVFDGTFSDLIRHLNQYVRFPLRSPERNSSPFNS